MFLIIHFTNTFNLGEKIWMVEEILNNKTWNDKNYYFIKWKFHSINYSNWILEVLIFNLIEELKILKFL